MVDAAQVRLQVEGPPAAPRWRRDGLVLLFFGVSTLALLAPMASDTALPLGCDLVNHLVLVTEARDAFTEGQFPLRVLPGQQQGRRYPGFQFYSQLPYTVAGLIHRWVVPDNPFVAYKWTAGLFLWLGGVFLYRLAYRLVRAPVAAAVAGFVYQAAPYLLLNLHVRAAFAEFIGQALIPVVLYASVRHLDRGRPRHLVGAAAAWSGLALTHLITFAYGTLFVGALLLVLAVRRAPRARRLVAAGLPWGLGVLLALYFLAPVALVGGCLKVSALGPVFDWAWLTPLSALLSPTSCAPVPLGTYSIYGLHPAVGLVIVAAVGTVLAAWVVPGWFHPPGRGRDVARWLLVLFGVAFVMAWSPVDFWRYLPHQLWVIQFPYRMLAQTCWTGALLVAYAVCLVCGPRPDARHFVAGVCLAATASASYLPTLPKGPVSLAEVMTTRSFTYAGDAYLVRPDACPGPDGPGPAEGGGGRASFRRHGVWTVGTVAVDRRCRVPLPVLYYPRLLEVSVDGRAAPYVALRERPTGVLLAGVELGLGEHRIRARFRGLPAADWVSAATLCGLGLFAAGAAVRRLARRRRAAGPPAQDSLPAAVESRAA